jgi:hypothetical protein
MRCPSQWTGDKDKRFDCTSLYDMVSLKDMPFRDNPDTFLWYVILKDTFPNLAWVFAKHPAPLTPSKNALHQKGVFHSQNPKYSKEILGVR